MVVLPQGGDEQTLRISLHVYPSGNDSIDNLPWENDDDVTPWSSDVNPWSSEEVTPWSDDVTPWSDDVAPWAAASTHWSGKPSRYLHPKAYIYLCFYLLLVAITNGILVQSELMSSTYGFLFCAWMPACIHEITNPTSRHDIILSCRSFYTAPRQLSTNASLAHDRPSL